MCSSFAAASYRLTHPVYDPGFFSVFNTVLGALDHYEKSPHCNGLVVDFEDQGFYYDQARGSNWWQYYFEPIRLGSKDHEKRFPTYKKITFSLMAQFDMTRHRGHELIKRYIHLKPHIKAKLNDFVKKHFQGQHVVGVHYRGTDKKCEAAEVTYAEVANKIGEFIKHKKNTKVFVATDEKPFLSFMHEKFPGKIIATDAIRSQNKLPVHISLDKHSYQKGEDALLDCLLLAKCSKLIKMASNLSDTSLRFNPAIQAVHLNTSFSENYDSHAYNPVDAINTVLALLDRHEKNDFSDFTVNFPLTEAYKNRKGINWWLYHFLPLSVGTNPQPLKLPFRDLTVLGSTNLFEMPKDRAHQLIKKHIRFRPHIDEMINQFVQSQFDGYHIIGVNFVKSTYHWETTVPYEQILQGIKEQVKKLGDKKYKLFVVTQDEQLIKVLREAVSANICLYKPDHGKSCLAENEERELVENVLLSKSNVVIGTSTTALKLVAQLNPKIPVIELDTLWLEKH